MAPKITLPVVLSLATQALGAFGPSFGTGATSSGVYIVSAVSTLIVPEGNSPFAGDFSLWCGMGTSAGDLIQSIIERDPNNDPGSTTPCETVTTQTEWCGYSYTLFNDGYQDISYEARINTGDHVTFEYTYSTSTGNYSQNLMQNGNTISTLSTSDGVAQGWGTATECAADDCGTFPAHQWINTKIVLSAADPDYGSTKVDAGGTTDSGFSSPDGGTTWEVTTINIPSYTY